MGGVLSVILYFLVVLLGVIFLSTQTTSIFGDQSIIKLSCILIERTGKISSPSFSI